MRKINLNFLAFEDQDFGIKVYRKKATSEYINNALYYDLLDENDKLVKYEIFHEFKEGYEEYKLPSYFQTGLVSKYKN